MPWADRSNFYKYGAKYCYLELRPIAVIRTAYSCPYSCAFCYRNRLNCHRYTARDIEDVVNEIESIDCENIYIVDDDFLVNIHRLERFIELIKARNIRKKYVCFGRADFIAKYPHVIKKLAQIGFYYILTGLEYIENRRLNDTDKRNDVNTNVRALRTCREFGINMMGMFITDLDFTAHDFSNLYKWIRHFDLRHVAISIYTPEMCLENFAEYEDRLITTDPAEWDYLHVVAKPEKMSVRKYYFHYHILLIKLFLRAQRQGVYDFMDYKAFIRSFLKNLFSFGG
ncbi:MAG: radical SAM protein [Lachnospiraceae bacterium]|nr:radical SAM protein [Lachnospiraceae bacterium]